MQLRVARTDELDAAALTSLRTMVELAFDLDFPDAEWEHALGGVHFLLEDDGALIAHASVVPRELETSGRRWRTGYVEAVATRPDVQGLGHGTRVMRAADEHIANAHELGALSTGEHGFYERLGWRRWKGTTGVRSERGVEMTPWEDGSVMVLPTARSLEIELGGLITCEWRAGDVW